MLEDFDGFQWFLQHQQTYSRSLRVSSRSWGMGCTNVPIASKWAGLGYGIVLPPGFTQGGSTEPKSIQAMKNAMGVAQHMATKSKVSESLCLVIMDICKFKYHQISSNI
jgi:glycogen synthase